MWRWQIYNVYTVQHSFQPVDASQMCLELKGFCVEETDYSDSVRFGVQNISDHPSLIPVREKKYEPLFTSNSVITDQITWNASWKHLLYLQSVRWPTWALAITLHRLPASASEAEFDFAFPFCIPGNAGRESRWSSSRLPCELANREKNFSGSASGKVKTVTDV